jgi:transcriptional regulator GlxA family with amidase domain
MRGATTLCNHVSGVAAVARLGTLALALTTVFMQSLTAADAPSSPLKVAFVVTHGANVIDLCGPWEVFQDTTVGDHPAFQLFTVSDTTKPVEMTGGFRTLPHHTFADSPHPDIVVVGAQRGAPELGQWLRARVKDSKVVMSVCTGAFKLADAGILDGKKATTHHDFWDAFAEKFPKVQLERGSRFVQSDDVIFTAGGLTSGIDLALHIVEKLYGREAADRTAAYMEYRRAAGQQDHGKTGQRD